MPDGKTLSQAIKDQLLEYQNSELREIRTWKRGVLPPTPTFPACSVMPERVRILYPRNRQAELHWDFNIELFARHKTPREALETVQRLAQAVKMIIKQHFKFGAISGSPSSTLVLDTEIKPVYEEVIPQPTGQYMHMAVVPLEVIQYEDLPEELIIESTAGLTDGVELVQFIENRLEAFARDSSQLSLRQVAQFSRSLVPPIPQFPAITISGAITEHDRALTGLDIVNHSFDFSVFTSLLPQEVNLDLNLVLVDLLIQIIWVNFAWGGRAEMTTVEEVEFVRERSEVGHVYRSTITANVQCREKISLEVARR